MAKVTLLDTEKGRATAELMKTKKPLELAAGGQIEEATGNTPRVIKGLQLRDTVLTHCKVK